MTDTASATAAADPVDLAAQLASRLCHDFISPVSAIVSGLDLIEDEDNADMKEEALGLIASSGRKLADLLAFSRAAYGSAGGTDLFDTRELQTLTGAIFSHMRAELDWQVQADQLCKPAARTLLNLAQIAGTAMPAGGKITCRAVTGDGRTAVTVEACGGRVRLKPEVLGGLKGEPKGDAMGGAWIQAFYVHSLIAQAGGKLAVEATEEAATLGAWVPA